MAIINGVGRVGIRVTSGSSPAPSSSYLLNNYGGASVTYSLRKLSSTSTYAIKVRRSSDNTEMNIGFDVSGNLDTTALTTFVGAGNGFVTTWYDQSGLGRDAINTTATQQPKIVTLGTINMLNGKPSIRFEQSIGNYLYVNSSSVLNIQDCISTFTVANFVGNGGYYGHLMSKGYGSEGSYSLGVYDTVGNKLQIWTESDQIVFTPTLNINQQHIYSNTNAVGSNGIKLYVDNSLFSEKTTTNNLNGTNSYLFTIGRNNRENSYYLDGNIQEMVCYPTYQQSNLSNINSNLNTYYSIYPSDSDAAAFVSAAGITNSTQMSAVNTLVTSLKSSGIWSKMKAIYPVVGGNATAHSKNLKNPSQYQLTFSSGWSHSSTGMLPNGTSAFADTLKTQSEFMTPGSGHMSYYSRSTGTNGESRYEMGNYGGAGYTSLAVRVGDKFQGHINTTSLAFTTSNTDGRGFYIASRISSTNIIQSKNLTQYTGTSTEAFSVGNIVIGGIGTISTPQFYSNKECSFASIGGGLDSTDMTNYYNAVQAFQTTLGRQVV